MEIKEIVAQGASAFGVSLEEEALDRFQAYCDLLLEWNEKMNLTAIRKPEEVAVKHFVDSLSLLSVLELPRKANVIDIGTGAGFPGVPLKIARTDLSLTLLDSLNKRLVFLGELAGRLGLTAELLHMRAEEGGRQPQLREQFDAAVSRAVASLNLLAEYCLPYVKVGGVFASMKGPDVQEELEQAKQAISLLGGKIREVKTFALPDGSRRSVILIDKVVPTPEKYPRHGSKIAKRPL